MEHIQLTNLTEVYLVSGWLTQALSSHCLAFFNSSQSGQNTYYAQQSTEGTWELKKKI